MIKKSKKVSFSSSDPLLTIALPVAIYVFAQINSQKTQN